MTDSRLKNVSIEVTEVVVSATTTVDMVDLTEDLRSAKPVKDDVSLLQAEQVDADYATEESEMASADD